MNTFKPFDVVKVTDGSGISREASVHEGNDEEGYRVFCFLNGYGALLRTRWPVGWLEKVTE